MFRNKQTKHIQFLIILETNLLLAFQLTLKIVNVNKVVYSVDKNDYDIIG